MKRPRNCFRRSCASAVRITVEDAYVEAKYCDCWFVTTIAITIRVGFTFLMLLFSLTETGTTQTAPIVTAPAG